MPKRTRSEKILAKERRLKMFHLTPPSQGKPRARSYFISDFKRSLLFISLVIALEIVVYFGTINNYLKF